MRIRDATPTARIHGFPPVENPSARILILGSMPGEASLHAGQYYAHPQNQFWKIAGEVFRDSLPGNVTSSDLRAAPYPARLAVLEAAGIALWDVIASCHRQGSLDADIARDTLVANDFSAFFIAHPRIGRVLFNGAQAEASFRRHVAPTLQVTGIAFVKLPSTSPANASIPYARKLALWREALALGQGGVSQTT